MFKIEITKKTESIDGGQYMVGNININKFREEILMALKCWNRNDYINQWKDEIGKLLNGSLKKTALVVDIYTELNPDIVTVWPIPIESLRSAP